MLAKQATLFEFKAEKPHERQEWGTFKDSLRAPIHSWFTYPAGFSYKAVESSFRTHHIQPGGVVYDPFMGTGTTNVGARKLGISSYGVEAHSFVFRVAKTKLNWDIKRADVTDAVRKIEKDVRSQRKLFAGNASERLKAEFPELVLKCYEDKTLLDLLFIREAMSEACFKEDVRDFLFVGLTSILRQVSAVETGWPYIAPKKQKTKGINKDALAEFSRQVMRMLDDVEITKIEAVENYQRGFHQVFNADSRDTHNLIPSLAVDHVFTSPPYLNNFDYADRTRLELYFFGEAKNWGEITQMVRAKLITSATTQISREDPKYNLSEGLRKNCSDVFAFLDEAVGKLSRIRLTKGGKKSYDHLVAGYFNDMFLTIADVYRVLRPGANAVFVLGDSAPYGVHITTDELIGKIGLSLGFSDYGIEVLRTRGGKWKENPQRHNVSLRESIVTLKKA